MFSVSLPLRRSAQLFLSKGNLLEYFYPRWDFRPSPMPGCPQQFTGVHLYTVPGCVVKEHNITLNLSGLSLRHQSQH